jgi:hypothetical protein
MPRGPGLHAAYGPWGEHIHAWTRQHFGQLPYEAPNFSTGAGVDPLAAFHTTRPSTRISTGFSPRRFRSPRSSQHFAPISRVVPRGPETKYFDCTGSHTAHTWNGTDWGGAEVPCTRYVGATGVPSFAGVYTDPPLIPSAVPNTDGYGQISGSRFRIKKLTVRGVVTPPPHSGAATAYDGCISRVLLVLDRQPNNAQASGADVLQDMGDLMENFHAPLSMANFGGRFIILDEVFLTHDVMGSVNNASAGTISNSYQPRFFNFEYRPRRRFLVSVDMSGNVYPDVANLNNCNIFLMCGCVQLTSDGVYATGIHFTSRCEYYG